MSTSTLIRRAKEIMGGQKKLAAAIIAVRIEVAKGGHIGRADLRPDLWRGYFDPAAPLVRVLPAQPANSLSPAATVPRSVTIRIGEPDDAERAQEARLRDLTEGEPVDVIPIHPISSPTSAQDA